LRDGRGEAEGRARPGYSMRGLEPQGGLEAEWKTVASPTGGALRGEVQAWGGDREEWGARSLALVVSMRLV
jgi:hypothetical protein